ncbi:uncharacterized protein BKA78DRAFT_290817 [Phyllosticta capitalensis]|uniref:uncharacterized protein n=1 Tax=Phyllosticta capitalensis TaxID=121624 RepID=UPI00312DB149
MSEASTASPLPPGYPKLAQRMGLKPETAIFRRFAFLNKLNILYLQAELAELEKQLTIFQRDAAKYSTEDIFARNWSAAKRLAERSARQPGVQPARQSAEGFVGQSAEGSTVGSAQESAESDDDEEDEQLRMVLEARDKLEKYTRACSDAAIIQQSRILAMEPPKKMDLEYIQKFIADPLDMGHDRPFTGPDAGIWGTAENPTGHAPDIITPYPSHQKDRFSKLVKRKFFDFGLHKILNHIQIGELQSWDERAIDRLTFVITTAFASILPVVSVIILYYVEPMGARFGLMALFNIITSICLSFLTNAKRSEIFAVIAAFTAVTVVFVQNNGPQTVSS